MTIKYTDLFCGIGGFRIAAEQLFNENKIIGKCVLSCDIDDACRESYYANFGDYPEGDITKISADSVPDHDILFAGFPCQPFSIIGNGKGFEDTRGTLFFDIARIIETKKPKAFILENVKRLVGHNKGHTLKRILETLRNLGYFVDYKVLNALDYGLPQKRERVFIIGYHNSIDFEWPSKLNHKKSLMEVLEHDVDPRYFASEYIRIKRKEKHKPRTIPSIWHENKSGNISSYPFSCALRAGASYNYLLVNGERRLTPREMLRLQGFPDSYKIIVNDSQIRKQAGNSVPVNLVRVVLQNLLPYLTNGYVVKQHLLLFNEKISKEYGTKKISQIKNSRKSKTALFVK